MFHTFFLVCIDPPLLFLRECSSRRAGTRPFSLLVFAVVVYAAPIEEIAANQLWRAAPPREIQDLIRPETTFTKRK